VPDSPDHHARRYIFVVTPGGINVQGGMATMARYMLSEWQYAHRRPPIKLINTSGPSLGNIATMPFYLAAATFNVAAYALLRRIALLHLHMSEYGSVVRKGLLAHLGKFLGVPIVIHMHGAKFTTMWEHASPRRKSAILGIFRRADAIVVLGQFWRQYLVDHLQQPAAKIHVVANGVPDPGLNSPPPPTPGQPVNILFAGQVGQRKGVGDLLAALALPSVRNLPWCLTVAGSGEIPAHQEKAQQLCIADRVNFLGWVSVEEVRRHMRSAHIFVLPSYQEGLPMAILEAMANALPVISTPVGSIPDMLLDGVTGLLVPPGNPTALSNAFERLLTSPQLRASLGANARKLYLRDFTVAAMCDRLQAVFTSVTRANP